MNNLPDDIIEYIYKILHKKLLLNVLKALLDKFIKWEDYIVKRFNLKLYNFPE